MSTALPTKRVSIVVPTKNRAQLLKETIQSVLLQTSPCWELVIIDDGSTDDTAEMMADFVQHDNRIRFLRREGDVVGANVCRNQGARVAQADWIMFLDSDDLLAENCVENRIRWLERNQDLDFIVCHADAFLDKPGDLNRPASCFKHEGDLDRFLFFDLPWLVTGPTWRKSTFLKIGGFNESIPSWQDIELHVRAILSGSVYLNLPSVDYHVRWQNDSSKTSLQQGRSEQHLLRGERTIDGFEQLLCSHGEATWSRLRAIAGLRFIIAEHWANQKRWSDAKRVWRVIKRSHAYSPSLYFGGKLVLLLKRLRLAEISLVKRCIHYWKGFVRLRQEPRLVRVDEQNRGAA